MTKNKTHYYVIVFAEDGARYVTSTEGHYAKWEHSQPPLELSKAWAEDIALGLNWNGFNAVVVASKWEIEHHPYRYEDGQFIWQPLINPIE